MGAGFLITGPIMIEWAFNDPINLTPLHKMIIMPPSIDHHIEHQGQTWIVGHGGRLYAPRTSIDAWGRTRHTQKVTKYRLVACACGSVFIAHDARMKTCEACQAHAQRERRIRCTVKAQWSPVWSTGRRPTKYPEVLLPRLPTTGLPGAPLPHDGSDPRSARVWLMGFTPSHPEGLTGSHDPAPRVRESRRGTRSSA